MHPTRTHNTVLTIYYTYSKRRISTTVPITIYNANNNRPPKINNGGRKYHRSASLPSSFTSMTMDDTINDNEPYSSDEFTDNHHTIDRFAIAEVICRECYTRQSSKT